jgi:selenocysteine lyase/cysteine desulfurase
MYFDQAATTFPKPQMVYDYANEWYSKWGGNAGRGMSPFSRKAAQLIGETRKNIADLLGLTKVRNIVFYPSITIALNQAILGLPWQAGDTFFLSPFEHNAVARVAETLKKQGVNIKYIPYKQGMLQEDEFVKMLQIHTPRAVAHIRTSNVTGDMFDITSVMSIVKRYIPDAVTIVDDAQTAGLYSFDLSTSGIDLYTFSGHKSFYAPMGIAGLVFIQPIELNPYIIGGTGTQSEQLDMPDEIPARYEAGSHNTYSIAGLYAATNWLKETGVNNIQEKVQSLHSYFWQEVKHIVGIKTISYQEKTPTGIISLRFFNLTPQQVETFLGSRDICVRAGLHCAPLMHKMLGTLETGGVVRFSFGYFNTRDEVDKALECLEEIVDM